MVADLVEKGRLEYRIEWVGEEPDRQIEEAAGGWGAVAEAAARGALPGSRPSRSVWW